MADCTRLQRVRGGYRKAFTKLVDKLRGYLTSNPPDERLVKATLCDLTNRHDQIIVIDEKIIDVIDVEDIESEVDSTSEYLETYNMLQTEVEMAMSKQIHANQSSYPMSTDASQHIGSNVRLPKLSLPHFNGDILEWTAFWESFSGAVHNNIDLSGANKFEYLFAQIHGEAAALIEGFQHTGDAYLEAVKLLEKTYGNKQKIIRGHLYHIFDLPNPSCNAKDLTSFRNSYESHLRSLKVLNIDVDAASHVYTALLTRKLPMQTRDNISRATRKTYLDLNELRSAIDDEIEQLEMWDPVNQSEHRADIQSVPPSTVAQRSNSPVEPTCGDGLRVVVDHPGECAQNEQGRNLHTTDRLGTISSFHVSTKATAENILKCEFCDGNHKAIECDVYDTARKREAVVKARRLCYKCLSYGHRVDSCRSTGCIRCSGKHHVSICFSLRSDKRYMGISGGDDDNRNEATSALPIKLRVDLQNNINECMNYPEHTTDYPNSANNADSSPGSPPVLYSNTSTILPTAVVGIASQVGVTFARTLFDQGSQKSFLLEETAREMGLTPCGKTTITINGFINRGVSRLYDVVRINTVTDYGYVPINVIVVDKLPKDIMMNGRSELVHTLRNQGIHLADPYLDDDISDIQLIVGGDHYFDFVFMEKSKDIAFIPSKLGYLLSGQTPINCKDNSSISTGTLIVTALHVSTNNCDSTPPSSIPKALNNDENGLVFNRIVETQLNNLQTSPNRYRSYRLSEHVRNPEEHPVKPFKLQKTHTKVTKHVNSFMITRDSAHLAAVGEAESRVMKNAVPKCIIRSAHNNVT